MAITNFLSPGHRYRRLWSLFGLLCYALLAAAPALAANSAVIFMYHRFGEDKFASTSITIKQFESQIAELKRGKYRVMALPDIVAALKSGQALPDRTVGISIDDAYSSVYSEAWPRFKAAGFPFTLFVATDQIDRKIKGYMDWRQIRQLQQDGVTIGSQSASHLHMASAGSAKNRRDLEKSNARFVAELGRRPKLIAYPYGEAGLAVMKAVKEAGFSAGFGQHSGVASDFSNIYYLPRFALNEQYGGIERFRLAANALALPAFDITPADPLIGVNDENPPAFGFTIKGGAIGFTGGAWKLSCFSSREGRVPAVRLGGDGGDVRIEVRMTKPMPAGRSRLNCTLPANDGRWRWFGRQFFVAK